MRIFATLGFAGLILAGSVGTGFAGGPAGDTIVAGKVVRGIVASTQQPVRNGMPGQVYEGYWAMPPAYYGQPALRPTYYTDAWCQMQDGEYNPYSRQVTETNGRVWQCGPPRY